MTDTNSPVTEDELHAYVDNELPVERRAAVEAWLAAHPDEAERVTSWRAMSDALHAKYDAVMDEPVPARLSVDQLSRTPRRWMMGAIAATLLKQHEDLCGFYGIWDGQDVGTAAAIREAGKTGKVVLTTGRTEQAHTEQG